ncbi:hypothetical protein B0T25DRAFT_460272 [Lasiosphaeria hispida]|uniref:C2H2-type domain-containing protein n=1 Tax=Lasiosphaeria hispida TaxID=260671 RepID=A0AAJ0HBI6_9PEZI|nr:hypothetical protein B0T25DRAFT_460272 [Lasiosphaeria hispida]
MFECGTCGKEFPAGPHARDNHCRSTGHDWPDFECDTCDRYFRSESARLQHMRDLGHFDQQDCESEVEWCSLQHCYFTAATHNDIKDHEVREHFFCRECDRLFDNYNNIKMHLNSRTHRGQSVKCPFCSVAYTTATGMTHHLECGACPRAQGLNRDEIYRIVRSKDPNGMISKKLITWPGESNVKYEATSRTWNGHGYECYLCNRAFSALHGLNAHLNSPAHQQALYHCPKRSCGSDFKTLAAIINHLESESCGATRFDTVQRRIGDIVTGNRLISF